MAVFDTTAIVLMLLPGGFATATCIHQDQTTLSCDMTNFADRTIWTGDNLDILRGVNSSSVDLIYLEPPSKDARNLSDLRVSDGR